MQISVKLSLLAVCLLACSGLLRADLPESELAEANRLIKEKRYDEARELLTDVINQFPDHINALKMRAHVYFFQNNDEMALEDFNLRAGQRPDHANSYTDLAIVHYRMKNYDAALENIERALAIRPASPFAFKVKILILKEKQK